MPSPEIIMNMENRKTLRCNFRHATSSWPPLVDEGTKPKSTDGSIISFLNICLGTGHNRTAVGNHDWP